MSYRDRRGGGAHYRDRGGGGGDDRRERDYGRMAKERSMTVEAPMQDPDAPMETLLCQACANYDASIVCYDCTQAGALYCEECFQGIHQRDSMLQNHQNKGPVLRCKRGDCTSKIATWWCTICKDVCQDCASTHCSKHKDKDAILLQAASKNAELIRQQGGGGGGGGGGGTKKKRRHSSSESSYSSSDSDSSASSDRRPTRKTKKDELVPTWGRGKAKDEALQDEAYSRKGVKIITPPGMPPNPKAGIKLPNGNIVGVTPPLVKAKCDYCREDIIQQRYKCATCDPPYILCPSCFGTVKHKHDTMLMCVGFSLTVVPLPSSSKRSIPGKGRGRSTSPQRDARDISPCKKHWEGRCSEPCPWGRPHVKQDRPDHCCYICGGTGHFAKECKNRRRLEGGDAEEIHHTAEDPQDDGVSMNSLLCLCAKHVPTEEERLARSIVGHAQLRDRVQKLLRMRKKKKLRKKGVEVSDDEDDLQEKLLTGIEDMAKEEILPPKVRREPTPEIDEISFEEYSKTIGTDRPADSGRNPKEDTLERFKMSEIYDAARERGKGDPVPDTLDSEGDWDQEYFESFRQRLSQSTDPTYKCIDELVRREVSLNRDKHREIMCSIECKLQDDSLSHLQLLTVWYIIDAIFKQVGGHFVRDMQSNLQILVEAFMPCKVYGKWRTRCRDMLRTWRDILPKDEVDRMLDVTR